MIRLSSKEAIAIARVVLGRRDDAEVLAEYDSLHAVRSALLAPEGCKVYVQKDSLGRRIFRLAGYAQDGADVERCRALGRRGLL